MDHDEQIRRQYHLSYIVEPRKTCPASVFCIASEVKCPQQLIFI